MEKQSHYENTPVLERQEIKDFVADRNISREDYGLIEKLASFPKNILIEELHNFFNNNKERSPAVLERMVNAVDDENKKILFTVFLEFAKKYDWSVCWNLERVLERM